MTSKAKVYIAGVGFSPLPHGSSLAQDLITPLVSAATKALLDGGVTYDDIDNAQGRVGSQTSTDSDKAINALGEEATDNGLGDGSDFVSASNRIANRGARNALVLAVEKSNAVALLLVSDSFLWSRPYLKDQAMLKPQSDAPRPEAHGQATQGLYDLCQMVYMLRGWSHHQSTSIRDGRMPYQGQFGQSFELSRADAKGVPDWKDIEHKQDGRHRLGYNPATETRDISEEDLQAVRASGQGQEGTEYQTHFHRKGGYNAALAKL